MIKKITAYLLLMTYLLVSTGLYGAVHYCSEQFVSISLFDVEKSDECSTSKCCKEAEENTDEKPCCDTELFSLDFASERVLLKSTNNLSFDGGRNIVFGDECEPTVFYSDLESVQVLSDGPPVRVPSYIQNCALVFYD
ncbi:HYC_CC_PP family protein [Membranihabitans maritimus]|uniref:HYC_CC_PP family protein n=1 Tax=Membranihabitans maritimus TaxID=2904244 RepID=UPI003F72A589